MRRLSVVIAFVAALALSQGASAASIVTTYPVGDQPYGVQIDPADGRVYVANSGGSTVSVVNPATGAIANVSVGSQPGLLALDPVARRLYVSNSGDVSLSVVDVTTLSVVATILDTGGLDVAVDPVAHRAWVVGVGLEGLNQLVVVNTLTNTVFSTTIGFGQSWFGLAHDASLDRLYITNMNPAAPTLRVVRASDLAFVGQVPLPKPVRFALAVNPSTHDVYLASEDPAGAGGPSSDLYVVRFTTPTTPEIVQTTPLGGIPGGIELAPARNRIYVTDILGGRLLELDDDTFALVGSSDLPLGPAQLALHPDGRLYVARRDADQLAAVAVGNTAPVIDSLTLSPDPPRTNDLLTAAVVAHDPDGDALTVTYRWSRNGTVIAGATGSTLNLAASGAGDRGDTITVDVTVSDLVASVTATASVVVGNTAPVIDSLTLSPDPPRTNDLLTAAVVAHDPDGDALTVTYRWSRNGTVIAGATGSTLNLAASGAGDRGDTITVDVTVSDLVASVTATASVVVADTAPTVTVSLSDTSPASDAVLTATASGSDVDGDTLAYTFVWKVNGVTRETSTGADPTDAFDLGLAGNGDPGDTVTVEAVASDGTLQSPAASASALVVSNTAPTVAVTLSDSMPWKHDVLVASAEGQDPDGDPLTFTYEWRVEGALKRVTTTTATSDAFDLRDDGIGNGDVITVTVTASDGIETSAAASASATVTPPGQQNQQLLLRR